MSPHRQRVERQEKGGGGVVDGDRRLAIGEEPKLGLDRSEPVAPGAALEVELEVRVTPGGGHDGLHRPGGKRGPAQIRVEHHQSVLARPKPHRNN